MPEFDNSIVLAQLADALPFGVYIADARRKIHFWNRAAETITGHFRQEVIGRACCEGVVVHCTSSGAAACSTDRCPIAQALRSGEEGTAGLLVRHKAGHSIPVLIRSLPLRDEYGTVIAVAEIFHPESAGAEELEWIDKSTLHPTLGIPSVATTEEHLRSALARPNAQIGLFLIELSGEHYLEQRRGAVMVRAARAAMLQTLTNAIRMPRHIGCWTRDRFLVLVPGCTAETFARVQSELRDLRSGCEVTWWGDRVALQVNVAELLVETGESFEGVIERLDTEAKATEVEAGDRL